MLFSEKLANVRGDLVTNVRVDEHLLSRMMENSSLTFREKTDIQKVRALLLLVSAERPSCISFTFGLVKNVFCINVLA